MPDEAPKPRQTWRDWIPEGLPHPRDEELITREELLTRFQDMARSGAYPDADEISERTLRYWEALGILPGPVRRHHKGATRALYPEWMMNLVLYASTYSHSHVPVEDRIRGVRDMVAPTIIANYVDDLPLIQEQFPALLNELASIYQTLQHEVSVAATVALKGPDGKLIAEHRFPLRVAQTDE